MDKKCHDCGAKEGQLHKMGCDMEKCPFCGNQLISCPCVYRFLGYKYDWSAPFSGLPKEIYENGLSNEQEKEFEDILCAKGRIPYIFYSNICQKCGKLMPELFSVPDKEWQHYIEPKMQKSIICLPCYNDIKSKIDTISRSRRVIFISTK